LEHNQTEYEEGIFYSCLILFKFVSCVPSIIISNN
jgi:hypothetical protein